jgi:sugar lactone lactonase YvrE
MYSLFLGLAILTGDSGTVSTFAGTGKAGYGGDGGKAIAAQFNEPSYCIFDGADGCYVADTLNHSVRKIDMKTGVIGAVAGCGKKGYSGDGADATKATLNEPYALALDPDGNLYIVDRINAVVRKVEHRSGTMTTVAGNGKRIYAGDGGPAVQASLREPHDCCMDGQGGLLIADVADWRIRRLDLKTGKISTFAGVGKPQGKVDRAKVGDGGPANKAVLIGARAVCVDGKGNTYVCEREGNTIRKIDRDGTITTFAGSGAKGYSGDEGPALKANFNGPKGVTCDAAGNLFVVDTENHAIRRIDAKTGKITTVAGSRKGSEGDGGPATKAGLDRPHGCAVDAMGRLFIADTENHRIRVVPLE